jgi:hypothetical protein
MFFPTDIAPLVAAKFLCSTGLLMYGTAHTRFSVRDARSSSRKTIFMPSINPELIKTANLTTILPIVLYLLTKKQEVRMKSGLVLMTETAIPGTVVPGCLLLTICFSGIGLGLS